MSRGVKKVGEYARAAGPLYEAIPKAVWAALAVSLFANYLSGSDDLELGTDPDRLWPRILEEWRLLNEQGIVPQKPCALPLIPSEPRHD